MPKILPRGKVKMSVFHYLDVWMYEEMHITVFIAHLVMVVFLLFVRPSCHFSLFLYTMSVYLMLIYKEHVCVSAHFVPLAVSSCYNCLVDNPFFP